MATASIANLQFDSTSDTAFRSWGSQISAALQACGLVQTTDTGQINWSTVTRTINAPAEIMNGYEIYKFNDSLQATAPVFIKIEYGYIVCTPVATSYQPTAPSIYITVGTSTNGAGTLGGVLSTRTRLIGGAAGSNAANGTTWSFSSITTPCYFSGDGSYINIGLGISNGAIGSSQWPASSAYNIMSSFPGMLSIDRSRNSDGSINNHGLVLLTNKWATAANNTPSNAVPTCQYLSFTGQGVATQQSDWPIVWPGQAYSNGTNGSNLDFWPLAMATPQAEAQGISVLGCYKTDLAISSTVSINVSGSAHTYLSFGGISGTVANDNTRSYVNSRVPNGAIMMRYE